MTERINNKNTNTFDVMNSMNSVQKFLVPKYQKEYLPYLNKILELLLLLCDDLDVSVRHTASVVLSSSVTVILPFQKSIIVKFIYNNCNKAFQPHALISLLDLELQVTLFLTHKVAYQLFMGSSKLLNYCAQLSSEIVAEGLNKLASKIRLFYSDPEKRKQLISNLAKPKESVLSTRWSIQTAAIFAQPDLIDESLQYFEPYFPFLAATKLRTLPDIDFNEATLDDILPFIEINPPFFFNRLSEVPTNLREISTYFSCLKSAIPYGVEFPLEILTRPDYKSDPVIFSLQLECFALTTLRGVFEHQVIYRVFRDAMSRKVPTAVSSLAIVFNVYPSEQLFDLAMKLPTSSPSISKSLVIFLTEIDFDSLIDSHIILQKSIDKLAIISQSTHEMVQSILLEGAPLFNKGNTYPLFQKLYSQVDYFDPVGFRNSMTLLASLTNNNCKMEIESLFVRFKEVDRSIFYGDVNSLMIFLKVIRKICLNVNEITIPKFIFDLPLVCLRIIIAILTGEWNDQLQPTHIQNIQYNELREMAKNCQSLVSILTKQPLISLLDIRDRAAACASALKAKAKIESNKKGKEWDEKTFDLLGKKLIMWPSKKTWLLISNSAKTLSTTTGGVYSLDPEIALSAALKSPDKFKTTMINGDVNLLAFAICNNLDVDDYKITEELVIAMDRIAVDFPQPFVDKLSEKNVNWHIVFIEKHLDHDLITKFKAIPFEKWKGPPRFWLRLPYFMHLLAKNQNWICQYKPEKCDKFHNFFALRNIRYFSHNSFAEYAEIDYNENTPKKENGVLKESKTLKKQDSYKVISTFIFKPDDYYEPETLREMRSTLYSLLHYNTFEQLCSLKKMVKNCGSITKSIIKFLTSQECGIECFMDAFLLCLELSVSQHVDLDPILMPYLKYCPFRGYNAVYSSVYMPNRAKTIDTKAQITREIPPIPNFSSQIYLDSEVKRLLPIFASISQISLIHNSNNCLNPLSHITSHELIKYTEQKFSIYNRFNIPAQYSKENLASLKKHIEKYGISSFVIATIGNWIKTVTSTEIIQLLNFLLNYIANNGTYFTQEVAHLMDDAMKLHKDSMPVIEAFVLVLSESPFKTLLKSAFNENKKKSKKKGQTK